MVTISQVLLILSNILLSSSTSSLFDFDTFVGCAYSSKLGLTSDHYMGKWNSSYIYTQCKEQAYNNNKTMFIIRNKDECFTTNDDVISDYIRSDFGGCDAILVDGVNKTIGSNNQPVIYDMYEETSRSAVYQIPRVMQTKVDSWNPKEELTCPGFSNDYLELNLQILKISLSDQCSIKSELLKLNIRVGCNGHQRCDVLSILPKSCDNQVDIKYICLYSSKHGISRDQANPKFNTPASGSKISYNRRLMIINVCVIVLLICLFLIFKFCLMKYSPVRHFCWPLHEVVPCLGLFPKGVRDPDQREPVYERPDYRPIHVECPEGNTEHRHSFSFLPPFSFFKGSGLWKYDS